MQKKIDRTLTTIIVEICLANLSLFTWVEKYIIHQQNTVNVQSLIGMFLLPILIVLIFSIQCTCEYLTVLLNVQSSGHSFVFADKKTLKDLFDKSNSKKIYKEDFVVLNKKTYDLSNIIISSDGTQYKFSNKMLAADDKLILFQHSVYYLFLQML